MWQQNIKLSGNDQTIRDVKEITSKCNKYFTNIKKLNLKKKDNGTSFKSQVNCRTIKEKFENKNVSFEVFTEGTVTNAIKNLAADKVSVSYNIPVSIMRNYWYLLPKTNTNHDWLFKKYFFPDKLKKCQNNSMF